ncbi:MULTISPECIES: DUF969 domain-containing protein [unclassified Caulobacter]|uniref:DUF969 domain-containing protein n=1 Tax=unclassified Caulobacter TaxID=2648921 RepID=UPI000D3C3304|nr:MULTISPECIES: DUF969 domain-containing protein [unclassified Caulobacter]PTS91673.1 DUF969 domain-containing protein [Caulobacter sp. HMWF009]PTT06256.1 DUF969 domain-containing protein [Caulobacter sp. HMWF025]
MLTLLGVAVIVLGFALRFNPLLVVVAAALTAGLAAGLSPVEVIEAFGKAFNTNRYVTIAWLVLPAVGVLERCGLQERARLTIQALKGASAGRILLAYLLLRQLTAALGLTSVAGQAQTVRPLVAPMAEAAAETAGPVADADRERIRAMSAATDNVGLFFGEDIFMAIGSILLIVGFLDQSGITVEPLHLSVWAIPTAIAAFIVHGARLLLFDRRLAPTTEARP